MHQMCISTSDAQVEKVGNPKTKCENWKRRRMKTKQSAMKLSQIRRRKILAELNRTLLYLNVNFHYKQECTSLMKTSFAKFE
jgi:truncated hemoglobin YjbI